MADLTVGSRTHGRDTFLCLAKEKYPKEKPPDSRENPCAPRFRQGAAEGRSIALCRRAASLRRPFGLFLPKAPVLGATGRDFVEQEQLEFAPLIPA